MKTLGPKQIRKATILQIILGVSVSFLKKEKPSPHFPQIGKYKILSKVAKGEGSDNFSLGIYINGTEKVFIKTWSGHIKDLRYYSLLNEYASNKLLHEKLPLTLYAKDLSTPESKELILGAHSISLVSEHIDGQSLDELPIGYQKETFIKTWLALQATTDTLTERERMDFSHRTPLFYVLSFPLLFGVFAFFHPKKILPALLSSIKSVSSLKNLFKQKMVVTHRDILSRNIIHVDGKNFLLDQEKMCIAPISVDALLIIMNPALKDLHTELAWTFREMQNNFLQIYLALHMTISTRDIPEQCEHYFNFVRKPALLWRKN